MRVDPIGSHKRSRESLLSHFGFRGGQYSCSVRDLPLPAVVRSPAPCDPPHAGDHRGRRGGYGVRVYSASQRLEYRIYPHVLSTPKHFGRETGVRVNPRSQRSKLYIRPNVLAILAPSPYGVRACSGDTIARLYGVLASLSPRQIPTIRGAIAAPD